MLVQIPSNQRSPGFAAPIAGRRSSGGAIGGGAPRGFGALVQTPASIEAELRKTDTYYDSLNADVEKPQSPPAIRTVWRRLFDEWKAWFATGPSTWWASTIETAQDYQRRAEEIRASLVSVGYQPATPAKAAPDKPPGFDWSLAIKAAVALAVVAGVSFVVSRLKPAAAKAKA